MPELDDTENELEEEGEGEPEPEPETIGYVTVEDLEIYASAREIVIEDNPAVLLLKSLDWLDTLTLCFDRDEIPENIKRAQCIAALLIDSGIDLLEPIGRATKREKVDVIEVEYMDNAMWTTYYPQLERLLAPFKCGYGGFKVIRV